VVNLLVEASEKCVDCLSEVCKWRQRHHYHTHRLNYCQSSYHMVNSQVGHVCF